jgi:TatD DNase family protein
MFYVNAHTHHTPPEGTLAVVNVHKDAHGIPSEGFWSAGIHPWFIGRESSDVELERLRLQLSGHNVVAVGECGLDRLARTPWELQVELFEAQLTLAARFQKPVIIHNVRSGSDLLQIRKETRGITPWLIHGFHGSVREAELFVKHDCYLGFGRMLFNPTSKAAATCAATPMERILPETDNHPIDLKDVYQSISRIKGVPLDHVISSLHLNFIRLFKLQNDVS